MPQIAAELSATAAWGLYLGDGSYSWSTKASGTYRVRPVSALIMEASAVIKYI